jgi:CelD/BcsL family acetyltransferase involved in cellulose biosynthesis
MLRERLAIRTLAAIGSGVSDYCDILLDDRYADLAVPHLIDAMVRDRDWHVLEIAEVRPNAAAVRLPSKWPSRHWAVPDSVCLQVPARKIDELVADLPGRTRRTARWKLRKIDSLDIEGRTAAVEDIPAAITDLLNLHARQWEGRGINPEHTTSRFRLFLSQAAQELAQDGRASVEQHYRDGTLEAVELLLVDDDSIGFYLAGVAPELRRQIDASMMLLRHDLAIATSSSKETASFLRGTEPYKHRWNPQVTTNSRLLFAHPRHTSVAFCYATSVASSVGFKIHLRGRCPSIHSRLNAARGRVRAAGALGVGRPGRRQRSSGDE